MTLTFTLHGQVLSGKNHMQIGRDGRHYPTKRWAAWRDEAVSSIQIDFRMQGNWDGITNAVAIPCKATIIFTHADRRRRDVAGLIDALSHVLERAGVIKDDSLLVDWDIHTVPEPNKAKAGVEIRIETL